MHIYRKGSRGAFHKRGSAHLRHTCLGCTQVRSVSAPLTAAVFLQANVAVLIGASIYVDARALIYDSADGDVFKKVGSRKCIVLPRKSYKSLCQLPLLTRFERWMEPKNLCSLREISTVSGIEVHTHCRASIINCAIRPQYCRNLR